MIRPALPGDVPGLIACITAAYAPFFRQGLVLPPVSDGIADDIRDKHVWVAVMEGGIVGGVVLTLTDHAQLTNLAVHPDAGGQGVGRALMSAAMDAAGAAGYDRLHLATHAEMTATQTFYRRLGWRAAGQDGNKAYFEIEL